MMRVRGQIAELLTQYAGTAPVELFTQSLTRYLCSRPQLTYCGWMTVIMKLLLIGN